MERILILFAVLMLVGCATPKSPTVTMTEEQISHLSDERLCLIQQSAEWEPKLEVEIGKRNLECTEEYLACKRQGYQPQTPAFESCKDYQGMKTMATGLIGNAIRSSR